MNPDRQLIDAVDRVVREHGEYIPVEYLLAVGRLRYPEYAAWRCGEVAILEDVIIGNPARIADELGRAAERAGQLGLVAKQHEYSGWAGASGRRLRFSARGDAQSSELLRTHFERSKTPENGQRDLFLDGGVSALAYRLGNALIERRIDEAEGLMTELDLRDRNHPLSGALAALCAAQRGLSQGGPVVSVARELARIETQLAPAAGQALGPRARDFLAPFWSRLGDALAEIEFDPAAPRLHASWVYTQLLDWRRVEVSIRDQVAWPDHPELHWRLAAAMAHQSRRVEAIALWCRFCWSWPADWKARMNAGETPDPLIIEYWRDFEDADIEPVLEPDWFPAWILLREKGLALALDTLPTGAHPTQRGFAAMRTLIAHSGALDGKAVAARRSLKSLHAGLYAWYLQRSGE